MAFSVSFPHPSENFLNQTKSEKIALEVIIVQSWYFIKKKFLETSVFCAVLFNTRVTRNSPHCVCRNPHTWLLPFLIKFFTGRFTIYYWLNLLWDTCWAFFGILEFIHSSWNSLLEGFDDLKNDWCWSHSWLKQMGFKAALSVNGAILLPTFT